ncbi:MAG TPA: hypothetical protein VFZ53_25445 [Polyangiaceae bacterium]
MYRSPLCENEICLLRHSSIDSSNTVCTTACVTDADCATPYTFTPSCELSQIYDLDSGDTGVTVRVCMPTPPW